MTERNTDAQLWTRTSYAVMYRDAGAGVYLLWTDGTPESIGILSADAGREIGFYETAARNVAEADAAIRADINDPTKAYGEHAGLWTAGDPA